jgi:hypothetical protein
MVRIRAFVRIVALVIGACCLTAAWAVITFSGKAALIFGGLSFLSGFIALWLEPRVPVTWYHSDAAGFLMLLSVIACVFGLIGLVH